MNIKFFIKDFKVKSKEASQWKELISRLIESYARDLGLSLDYLQDVILADEEKYQQALKTRPEIRKFAHNDIYAKFAGTVLHEDSKGKTKASVIIRRELIEQILSAIEKKKKEWAYTELLYRYIIYHELGHCLDYRNRPASLPQPELDPDKFGVRGIVDACGVTVCVQMRKTEHTYLQHGYPPQCTFTG